MSVQIVPHHPYLYYSTISRLKLINLSIKTIFFHWAQLSIARCIHMIKAAYENPEHLINSLDTQVHLMLSEFDYTLFNHIEHLYPYRCDRRIQVFASLTSSFNRYIVDQFLNQSDSQLHSVQSSHFTIRAELESLLGRYNHVLITLANQYQMFQPSFNLNDCPSIYSWILEQFNDFIFILHL